MFKLIEVNEGEEKLLIVGNIKEVTMYLKENYEIFNFVWEGVIEERYLKEQESIIINTPYECLEGKALDLFIEKMPQLNKVEVLRDLKYELDKVDLDWWYLKVI